MNYFSPEQLLDFLKSKNWKWNIISRDYKDFSNFLLEKFSTLNLGEAIWLYIKNEKPKFGECGKRLIFRNLVTGNELNQAPYSVLCGRKCKCGNNILKNKRISTNLEKYGVENVFQSAFIKDKIKKTNLITFGVDNPNKNKMVREKIRKTNLLKYGVEFPLQNLEIYEKAKSTWREKYCVDNPRKSPKIVEKARKTNLEKYGVTHPKKNEEINRKIQHQIHEHNKQQYILQFGIENLDKILNPKSKDDLIGLGLTGYQYYYHMYKHGFLQPSEYKSFWEQEIKEFLDKNNIHYIINDKSLIKPFELDFFLPSYKLAIELNGLYWHTEISGNKNKNYHNNKLKLCNEQNIQLITIFEDEWLEKRHIVLNRLAYKLGLYNGKKYYARHCTVHHISNKEAIRFYEQTHIQPSVNNKFNYGLFYQNQLCQVMSFSKTRLAMASTGVGYELTRFASNCLVLGGPSKLFLAFVREVQPQTIISYSDNRWNTGLLYERLGFKLKKISNPNYWYVLGQKRFHRFKFRKSELVEQGNPPELSEWEIMKNNGYDRIWDCGNKVWEFKNNANNTR
jgi:hypothetical protein